VIKAASMYCCIVKYWNELRVFRGQGAGLHSKRYVMLKERRMWCVRDALQNQWVIFVDNM
jgi:hypothetical protein